MGRFALGSIQAQEWGVVVGFRGDGGYPAGVVSFEPARNLFHFGTLHTDDLAIALGSGLAILLLFEFAKRVFEPFGVTAPQRQR